MINLPYLIAWVCDNYLYCKDKLKHTVSKRGLSTWTASGFPIPIDVLERGLPIRTIYIKEWNDDELQAGVCGGETI